MTMIGRLTCSRLRLPRTTTTRTLLSTSFVGWCSILPILLLVLVVAVRPIDSTELIVVRVPKSDPSQATVVLPNDDGSIVINEDTAFTDIQFHLSDMNNYCVNVNGQDIVVATEWNLPSKCTFSLSSSTVVPMNETEENVDIDCFNILVASGSDAQATMTVTGSSVGTGSTCNTVFANGIRAQATISMVNSRNNATSIGEDAIAIIETSGNNNTAVAIGNRCTALISESQNDNTALTNGNDSQSKVLMGYITSATAGWNTTTDTGNAATAIGTMTIAIAINGTYNIANALHNATKAVASHGNYNNATSIAFCANSQAGMGNNNIAFANGVQTTAIAGTHGNFNIVNATGIGSFAQAINGEGNTVTADGMKAFGSSMNGSYNQLISYGMMAHAEVVDGDRNIVTINGTMSFGTVASSYDSRVLCSGSYTYGKCDMSSRSIVTAGLILVEEDAGYANATIIGGSDNTATAQGNYTMATIIDSGSYNHATATTNGCTTLIANGNLGGETQIC